MKQCPRPGTIYFTAKEMGNLRAIIGDLDNLSPDFAVQVSYIEPLINAFANMFNSLIRLEAASSCV